MWFKNMIRNPLSRRKKEKITEINRSLKSKSLDLVTSSPKNILAEALNNSYQIKILMMITRPKNESKEENTTKSIAIKTTTTTENPTTWKYQMKSENFTENTRNEEKYPDCTLRKWFWACRRFKSWSVDIF